MVHPHCLAGRGQCWPTERMWPCHQVPSVKPCWAVGEHHPALPRVSPIVGWGLHKSVGHSTPAVPFLTPLTAWNP